MKQNDKKISHLPKPRVLASILGMEKPFEIAEVTLSNSFTPRTEIAYILGKAELKGNCGGLFFGKTIHPKTRKIPQQNIDIYLLKDVIDYKPIQKLK